MNYVSITGITLGIAVVAVLVIGLLSYMSQLVKSAYQIKVEIRSDMEEGLRKIEEELTQKTKWMRSEVGEDVAKIRAGIEDDNRHRLEAIEARLTDQARELDEASRSERADLREMMQQARKRIMAMEKEIANLKDEMARRAALGQKRKEDSKESPPAAAPNTAAAAAATGSEKDEPQLAASLSSANGPRKQGPQSAGSQQTKAPAGSDGTQKPLSELPPGNAVVRTAGGVQRMELQEFKERT